MAKERPEGSGYHPFPLWEKEVESSLEKDLGFTGIIRVGTVVGLLGIITAQTVKEWAKKAVGKLTPGEKPRNPLNW